jgi:hypothetical protein
MGPLSCVRSIIDQNVVVRRIPVLLYLQCEDVLCHSDKDLILHIQHNILC